MLEIENFLTNKQLSFKAITNKAEVYGDVQRVIIATATDYDEQAKQLYTKLIEAVVADVPTIDTKSTFVIESTTPVGYPE
ncbi:hypothetical protein ABEQ93_12245 [Cutibacterium acnes]